MVQLSPFKIKSHCVYKLFTKSEASASVSRFYKLVLILLDLCVTSHGAAVTIKCPDSSENELKKKLPGTMTVQKLKGLLQRLYKIDSSEQRLSYLDSRVSHYVNTN